MRDSNNLKKTQFLKV